LNENEIQSILFALLCEVEQACGLCGRHRPLKYCHTRGKHSPISICKECADRLIMEGAAKLTVFDAGASNEKRL
jgi:ribosome-binding protein aMBF1 (putative translation factor)